MTFSVWNCHIVYILDFSLNKKKKDEQVHPVSTLAYSPILFRSVPNDNKGKKRRAAESVTCILNGLLGIYFMQYM